MKWKRTNIPDTAKQSTGYHRIPSGYHPDTARIPPGYHRTTANKTKHNQAECSQKNKKRNAANKTTYKAECPPNPPQSHLLRRSLDPQGRKFHERFSTKWVLGGPSLQAGGPRWSGMSGASLLFGRWIRLGLSQHIQAAARAG